MELDQALELLSKPKIEIGNGITGLNNLGNTCYLNAAIQALSHTIPFTNYILHGAYKKYLPDHVKDGKLPATINLFIQYVILINGIWEKPDGPDGCEDNVDEKSYIINPQIFVEEFVKFFPEGGIFRQNDSQESLIFLLDTFHELISRPVNYNISGKATNEYEHMIVKSINDWAEHFKNKHSYILDIFNGQEHFRLQCLSCKKMKDNFPPFQYICLPVNRETNTIYDCFDQYCSVGQLDKYNEWKCDKCNSKTQAYEKRTYWKLPHALIISFKRFQMNPMTNRYIKNSQMISYPVVDLDLSEYVTNPQEKCKYNLYSVICHVGNTSGGHYYANCLNKNGNWYEFNDESISRIRNLQELVTDRAYLLFYRKI